MMPKVDETANKCLLLIQW